MNTFPISGLSLETQFQMSGVVFKLIADGNGEYPADARPTFSLEAGASRQRHYTAEYNGSDDGTLGIEERVMGSTKRILFINGVVPEQAVRAAIRPPDQPIDPEGIIVFDPVSLGYREITTDLIEAQVQSIVGGLIKALSA